jgi:hypothetical protein
MSDSRLQPLIQRQKEAVRIANEASDNATVLRAKVAEGLQAQEELDYYINTRKDLLDHEIYLINTQISTINDKSKKSRTSSRARQPPYTIGNTDEVSLVEDLKRALKKAKINARSSRR